MPKKGLFGLFLNNPSLLLSNNGCVGGIEVAGGMVGCGGGIDVVVLGTNDSSCDDVLTGGC